jgi:hypothetical protein
MADANQQAQELAQTMARLNEEMALYGRTTVQSEQAKTDANMKAKYGIENFGAGTAQAAKALESLGGAALASMKAMAEGKKGANAFNSALDEMASAAMAAGAALALLVPGGIIFKALTAAVTAATVAYIKFTQMTLDMVANLAKGFQGLSKSGAAAADGMSGLYGDAKKLGLSMGELDSFVQLVAENSKDFALFAGSVSDGRKRIAEMGQAIEGSRVELFNLGMTTQDINAGMAGYIKLQTRLGQAQTMTTQQLATGALAYLKEQDALTKLTGQSRQEMEQQRERALQKEQFAAKIQELRNNGQKEAAERLLKLNSIYEAAGPQTASAFQASITGNLSNADAQKANLASNGEMLRTSQLVIEGRMSEVEAAQTTGLAIKQTANSIGTTLGQFGAYGNTFGELHEQLKLGQMATGNLVKNYDKILADQKNQMAGTDAMTRANSELINRQIAYNKQMENLMMTNVPAAQASVDALARSSMKAAEYLAKMSGKVAEKSTEEIAGTTVGGLVGTAAGYIGGKGVGGMIGGLIGSLAGPGGTVVGVSIGQAIGPYIVSALGGLAGMYLGGKAGEAMAGPEARAVGGPVSKSTPYLVGEEGPEIFVPKGAGDIVPNNRLGTGAAIGDNFSAAVDEMFKDVKKQEKILDVDTQRQKQFSDLQKRYFDTYGGFMKDVIEQVEDNDPADTTSTIGRMFSGMMGMFGGGGGGGSGLQMPKASNIMSMGGGQGLQTTTQTDLAKMGLNIKSGDVQAGGAGISPKLIEMAKAIQGGVPGFGYFSAFNDKFHQEKAPSSKHTQGLAADFTTIREPSPEDGKQITNWLKSMGASVAIDEYRNPSANAVGKGHFHVEIPAFEYGGDIPAGQLGIAGENGKPEIITGPASVTSNNDIMGAFNSMNGLLAQSVVKLDDLLRAQKDNNDISSKMLRMQT